MNKKNIPAAIEKAKEMLALRKESLALIEDLIVSLELEQAVPEVWDRGDRFKTGQDMKEGKVAFEYRNAETLWVPLSDLPSSYLERIRGGHHRSEIVRMTKNELSNRRFKAKRYETKKK